MKAAPVVLTVHAVDARGEEGVTADAATFAELLCRPVHVVTSLLLVGASGGASLEVLSPALVARQLETLSGDLRPSAARTGILADAAQVVGIAEMLGSRVAGPVVVAPVARVAGHRIADDATIEASRKYLFPLADVVLVRAGDLGVVIGERPRDVDGMLRAAAAVRAVGARAAIVAGGAFGGRMIDVLDDGGRTSVFDASRIAAPRVAGLAGAHAAALTAFLARGESLVRAADAAQRHVAFRLDRGV